MIEVKSTYSDAPYKFPSMFTHGLVGHSIDDRSTHSIALVTENSEKTASLHYRQESLDLLIDDAAVECHLLHIYFEANKPQRVLIDSTSLDIPELALILKSLHQFSGLEIMILYVEPAEYTSVDNSALQQQDFTLSNEISGFEGAGIPTVSLPVDNEVLRRFIFFVGFEGGRLQSAIETYDISSDEARIFFGIPAFQPGWEAKSIRRNLQALNDQSFSSRIGYCSASSCTDALRALKIVKADEADTINYVVPLGTKPNSLAAILFSIENAQSVRLLYDQPDKRNGRSKGVGRHHYFTYLVP